MGKSVTFYRALEIRLFKHFSTFGEHGERG